MKVPANEYFRRALEVGEGSAKSVSLGVQMDPVQSFILPLISCDIRQASSSLALVYPSVQWRYVPSRPTLPRPWKDLGRDSVGIGLKKSESKGTGLLAPSAWHTN